MNAASARPVDVDRQNVKVVQILAAARAVFLAHGYAAASMDEVVRISGVSKATVYAHFPGKQLLFAAIVADESTRFAGSKSIGGPQRGHLRLRLQRLGESITRLLTAPETCALYRMVLAEAARLPEMGQTFHVNGPLQLSAQVSRELDLAMRAGELRAADLRVAAEHFIGLVRGDLQLRALLTPGRPPGPAAIRATVRSGVDAFCRIYQPVGRKARLA